METMDLTGQVRCFSLSNTQLNNCAYYRSTFVSPGLLPGKGDAVLINCLTF
ncbi:hypothetical protein DES54_1771, partial [Brenneria salicis ATCC 15712 = DSM 30166]